MSIVGGRSIEEQQYNLRDGAEIIIATPGRLKDILEKHILVLGQCSYIVMDEADRMVDLGFEEELTYILDQLPVPEDGGLQEGEHRGRVTTLFSATMPPAVERISKKYLKKPAVVTIGVAGQVRLSLSLLFSSLMPAPHLHTDAPFLSACPARPSTRSSSASSSSQATKRRRRAWLRSCARAASSRP